MTKADTYYLRVTGYPGIYNTTISALDFEVIVVDKCATTTISSIPT